MTSANPGSSPPPGHSSPTGSPACAGVEHHNLRAIAGALLDVAPHWSRVRALAASGQIDAAMDVTTSLVDAVRLVRQARAQGSNVAELVGQRDMFAGDLDPVTAGFLRLMFRDDEFTKPVGRERLAAALDWYATEAEKTQDGPGLFGDAADPARTLGLVRERMFGDGPRADEIALDAQAEAQPPRPAKGEAGWRITPEEVAAHADIEPVHLTPAWAGLKGKPLFAAAKAWARENLMGRKFSVADTGWTDVTVSSDSVGKAVSARKKEGSSAAVARSPAEIEALRALPDLLDRAVLVESVADRAADPNIRAVHRLYAAVEIDGKPYRAKLTVKETVTGRRFYDHRLSELEAEAGSGKAETAASQPGSGGTPASALNVGRLLAAVKFEDGYDILADRLGDLAPRKDLSFASPPPPAPDAGAAEAAARVALPERLKDLAADLRVDPATGAYPEEIEIQNLVAEGRLTPEQEALLREADEAAETLRAEAEALEAAIACGKV